jgi:hypothetical protein
MNDFTNPDPYVTKVEDVVCRDCGKTFQINAQYDKNGFPVFFKAKYCTECNIGNIKPKITGPNGSWGTVNIESAKVPQKNVEGLEESLQTLATSIVNARDEFGAFKKHAEHDIEQNTNNIKKNTDDIMTNKLNLDVFKASQAEFNTKQSDFNISVLQLVREIHKTLIIGFSVFVFFMLVTWGYLTYTFFNH